MPASHFRENSEQINQNIQTSNLKNLNGIEEQRALQLALELNMLGLMNDEDSHLNAAIDAEARLKKSQNTTECVQVPSSEHVAEIVGRQGCKIKALRTKTNAYIKTPVRGEEPVFVVTGRKDDVDSAKFEILCAADHFSQIRAQRKNPLFTVHNLANNLISSACNTAGQCTIHVRVPYRVVGLVVGPKGATIKRIQQQTSTYIITPSREKEPVFDVTGLPDNVQTARKEIEAHIAIRTGDLIDSIASTGNLNGTQADELDTRDYSKNSSLTNGGLMKQLYSNSNSIGTQQNLASQNLQAIVAAKLNTIQNLNGLQLLTQTSQNGLSNKLGSPPGLSNDDQTSNGLSSIYSKPNGNSLENCLSQVSSNALTVPPNKSSDVVEYHPSKYSNIGLDALAQANILNPSINSNGSTANRQNSLSSSNNSSMSSNGNLSTSNNILNNLSNGSGLNMLNLQNAKNLLSSNDKFVDICSHLLVNVGNVNLPNETTNEQLLQKQHSISKAAAAVVNHLNLNNGLAQLKGTTRYPINSDASSTVNGHKLNNLNSSNNDQHINGSNSLKVPHSLYECDEGLGDSPTLDSIAAANLATLTNSLSAQIANYNTNKK